jgi:hypothetical protein
MLTKTISFYISKVPPNLYLLIVGGYILLEDWGKKYEFYVLLDFGVATYRSSILMKTK